MEQLTKPDIRDRQRKVTPARGLFLPTHSFGGNNVWSDVPSKGSPHSSADSDDRECAAGINAASSDRSRRSKLEIDVSDSIGDCVDVGDENDDSSDAASDDSSDETCSTASTFSCFSPRSAASTSDSSDGRASPRSVLRQNRASHHREVDVCNDCFEAERRLRPETLSVRGACSDHQKIEEIELPEDLYTHEIPASFATLRHNTLSANPTINAFSPDKRGPFVPVGRTGALGQPIGFPAVHASGAPIFPPSFHHGFLGCPPQLLAQQQMNQMYWQQMHLNQMRLQQAMYLQQQQQREWMEQQYKRLPVEIERNGGERRRFQPPRFLQPQSAAGTGVFIPPQA
ncbi:unnamed protein product [Closterium sp. NIES-54]